MFAPIVAIMVGVLGVIYSARSCQTLLNYQLAAFSHAGALVFASRSLSSESSDFINYYEVYEFACGSGSTLEILSVFDSEFGLPLIYHLLSLVGLCGFTPNGLAWLQGFVISAVLLIVISNIVRKDVLVEEQPLILAGLCLMFSFFFVTQLSRQAIASIFLISALWLAARYWTKLLLVLLGTLFHLSTPIIWGLGLLLLNRFVSGRGITFLFTVTLFLLFTVYLDMVVAIMAKHFGEFDAVFRFTGYFEQTGRDAGPASDWQTVVILACAAALLAWRARKLPELWSNVRVLTGFAVVAMALLPIHLAATRLMLPIVWFAGGAFLFRGLSARAIRPLGWILITFLLVYRVVSYTNSKQEDHSLWQVYPQLDWMPGYWLFSFYTY
jgi:hypothetical protein